jgi:hypothetical protein
MAVYTVLEPLHRHASAGERADHIVFLRDGFAWSAFVFAPLWLLYRRLWLVLLAYVCAVVVLEAGLWLIGVTPEGQIVIAGLLALLVGMEASNLRRWTLVRRGWQEVGTVVAEDRDEAEQRFFDAWVAGEIAAPPPRPTQPASVIRPPSRRDVVGLFPEPEPRR